MRDGGRERERRGKEKASRVGVNWEGMEGGMEWRDVERERACA